ncbi:hypothetical protein IGI39_000536 [Enterococcus sp. AZ135]|uniref:helix-hairpin-helix domain-containing protein n=1 Tax=unclassified Enterococcus TaxID=2608891 RepID=UPI003F23C8F3
MKAKVKKCLLVVVMVVGMVVSFGGNRVEASEKVDINSASVEELQKLEGVDAPLAQKIIDARPYKTVDELKSKVTGIGDAKLQAIKDQGLAVAESFPEKIDLNKASLYDLQFLVGVGAPLAQKIIDARPYQSVDELKDKVVGIGQTKLQDIKNQDLAMVNEEKMIKEWFPDTALAIGVAIWMNKNVEDTVSMADLAEITIVTAGEIHWNSPDVSNFEGVQHLVGLKNFTMSLADDVSDISNLGNLKQLTYLGISGGNINETSLESLRDLTNLTQIGLDLNGVITNLDALENLTKLSRINFRGGEIKDISALSNLKRLWNIRMVNCGLENIDALRESEIIQEINVEQNKLTNLDALANSKNLRRLEAQNNKLTNIDGIKGFKNIKYLDLSHNELESIDSMPDFDPQESLHFDFRYNHVYSIENVWSKLYMGTWAGHQKIVMPEQVINLGEDLLVENIVKRYTSPIRPLEISNSGTCEGQTITWSNLKGQGELSYRFGSSSEETTGYGFSGEVRIPYKVIE